MGLFDRFKDLLNSDNQVDEKMQNSTEKSVEQPVNTSDDIVYNNGSIDSQTSEDKENITDNINEEDKFLDSYVLHLYNFEEESRPITIKTLKNVPEKTFYIDIDNRNNSDSETIELIGQKSNEITFPKENVISFNSDFSSDSYLDSFSYEKMYADDMLLSVNVSDLTFHFPKAMFTLSYGKEQLSLVPQSLLNDELHLDDLGQMVQAVEKEAFHIFNEEIKEHEIEIPKRYLNQVHNLDGLKKNLLFFYSLENPSILAREYDRLEDRNDSIALIYKKSLSPCEEFQNVKDWVNSPEREKCQNILEELGHSQFEWNTIPLEYVSFTKELAEVVKSVEHNAFDSLKETDEENAEVLKIFSGVTDLNFKVHCNIDCIKNIEGKCKFISLRSHAFKVSNQCTNELEGFPSNEKPQLTITLNDETVYTYEFPNFTKLVNVLHGLNGVDKFNNYVKKALEKEFETTISMVDKNSIKYAVGNDGKAVIVLPGLNDGFKSRLFCNHIEKEPDGNLKVTIPLFPPQEVSVKKYFDNSGTIRVMNLEELHDIIYLNKRSLDKTINKVNLKLNEKEHENKEVIKERI